MKEGLQTFEKIENIEKNKYGFFQVSNKPSQKELDIYYEKKYYQFEKGNYKSNYTKEEKEYFLFKIEQTFKAVLDRVQFKNKRFIDVGCGEGWALEFFRKENWKILGLDYNNLGCKNFNPKCIPFFISGNIQDNLDKLIINKGKYDIIWLSHVLEHVLDPFDLLQKCIHLLAKGGVMIIKVPNDFSSIQELLLKDGHVHKPYWVATPDHLSYFNKNGLINLCKEVELSLIYMISDYPIDINLLNQETNYVKYPEKGKECHLSRIRFEKMINDISIEKTNNLYAALADLGLGREIIGIFKNE